MFKNFGKLNLILKDILNTQERKAFHLKQCNFYENQTTEIAAVPLQRFLNFRILGVWPQARASTRGGPSLYCYGEILVRGYCYRDKREPRHQSGAEFRWVNVDWETTTVCIYPVNFSLCCHSWVLYCQSFWNPRNSLRW